MFSCHNCWLSVIVSTCLAATIAGLQAEIKEATKALIDATSTVSVSSGCELFVRFITLTEMGEEAVSRALGGEVLYLLHRGHFYIYELISLLLVINM